MYLNKNDLLEVGEHLFDECKHLFHTQQIANQLQFLFSHDEIWESIHNTWYASLPVEPAFETILETIV